MSQEQLYKIHFLPTGREVEIQGGQSFIKAARAAGIHINASCGGAGVCGKCRVILEKGTVEGGRSDKLSPEDYSAGYRQACIAKVSGDATINVPEISSLKTGGLSTSVPVRHRAGMHRFDIQDLREEGIFVSPVVKLFLELPPASALDNMADAGRIILGLSNQYDERGIVTSLPILGKIRKALRDDNFRLTVTLAHPVNSKTKTHLINIQPGNWTSRNFGLAFDIGTTTVYGLLLDLNTGKVLARHGDYNGQLSYGEDVISRIIHAENPEGQEQMQEMVVQSINSCIDHLLASANPTAGKKKGKITRDEISSITLAGNTTMTHLLLGLEPDNIRRSPYVPVTTFVPPIRAADLNIKLPHHTVALLYPSISSYVGGDIVAGVMGSGMYRTDKVTLYIDIGTNAEIVIGNREWLACAACSAGPAFEGGGITHGMRAAAGAIEDFSLNPATLEPMNITIGNQQPVGICGSGLLVIVATLFENKVIDQSGKFNRQLDTPRIRSGRSGYEYVLAWKEESGAPSDIVINEVDIDNFIRAKAAIYAGVKTLVEEVGLAIGDLEQIILAGAFGSYIDLDSAMTIGLLPEVSPDKVIYVGNGSLLGSWMSALSNHIRQDVVDVVHRMTSFELSEVPDFKDQYVASLFLPHTDIALFPATGKRLGASRIKS
ncbi:MAG: ASKHA domain-containing protein [Desulfurivibrionaceae bacterium]|nr:ASKHA domain-containing protein [Desulfurivibrionaceae bacterium]